MSENNIRRKTIATQPWVKKYIHDLLHKYGISGVVLIDRQDDTTKRELFVEDDTLSTQRKPELEGLSTDNNEGGNG